MIVETPTVMAAPIFFLVWALDGCLFIVALRLMFGESRQPRLQHVCIALRQLTDWAPNAVLRVLRRYGLFPSMSMAWVFIVLSIAMLRGVLVEILIGLP